MLKAGELLQSARLKKKLTYTQVSAQLKLPISTLKALEKNHYQKLPSYTYLLGFIKNYAKLVGLDSSKIIAIFKRDYHQTKNQIIPKGLTKPLNSSWQLSPKLRPIFNFIIVILIFCFFMGASFYLLQKPPQLVISKPENNQEVTTPVLIKGKTDRDATLTLNGKTINLEPDGSFTTVYNGTIGAHELKFKATSRRQKATLKSLYLIII